MKNTGKHFNLIRSCLIKYYEHKHLDNVLSDMLNY